MSWMMSVCDRCWVSSWWLFSELRLARVLSPVTFFIPQTLSRCRLPVHRARQPGCTRRSVCKASLAPSLPSLGHLPRSYRACLCNVTATHSLRAALSTPSRRGQRRLRPRAQRVGKSRWTETYFCRRDSTGGFHAPIPAPPLSCPHSNHRAWRGRLGTVVGGRHGASRV